MIGFIVVDYVIKMDFVNVGCENQVHILHNPHLYQIQRQSTIRVSQFLPCTSFLFFIFFITPHVHLRLGSLFLTCQSSYKFEFAQTIILTCIILMPFKFL